jgi:hypothetical protein
MSYQSELEEEYTRLQKLKYSVHVDAIKKFVADLRKRWRPRTKEIQGPVYHGSKQGEEDPHTLYWDELNNEWTTKEFAFQGHLLRKVKDIINDNKTEKFKDII